MSRHAIIFLTHILSARVFRHFTRLQKETDGLLFSTFCLHVARPTVGKRLEKVISRFLMPTPRLEIDVKSGARLLPNRYAQMRRLDRWYNRGFPDLAYMPAMMSEQVRHYDYIWLVENDVDYAGHWSEFFYRTMENKADLLTTYAYSRLENRNWDHWGWFKPPPYVSFDQHTSSVNPIARFSRRMLSAYIQAVEYDGWEGHTEALWPTIVRHNGLTISDLGGTGPFCPEEWRNKSYYNPVVDGWDNHPPGRGDISDVSPRPFWLRNSQKSGTSMPDYPDYDDSPVNKITFVCYPTVLDSFFYENPPLFRQRNVLYHPVKAGPSRLNRDYTHLKLYLTRSQ